MELQVSDQSGFNPLFGSIQIRLCDKFDECCETDGRKNFSPSELVVYENGRLGSCEHNFFEDAQAFGVRVSNNAFKTFKGDSVTIHFTNGQTLFCSPTTTPMNLYRDYEIVYCV